MASPGHLARRGASGTVRGKRHPLALIALVGAVAAVLAAGLLIGPANATGPGNPTPTKHQVAVAQAKAKAAAKAVGTAQAKLAAIRAELARLNRAAEAAGQAYDGALYKLSLATQASQQAQARADAAQAKYDAAQRIVGTFASAAYRSGIDFGSADIFLGVDGPGGAVTRADTLRAVGAQVQRALLTAQSAKIVAGVLHEQAAAALATVRKAEQAVQATKQRADAAAAAQQARVAALNGTIAALQRELATAKANASSLLTARQRGLALAHARLVARQKAARARRAAERAAALARQQANSGSGSGSGSVSSVGGASRGTTAGAARAIAYAKAQLGKPYVYAADGPDSFDCSGLTMKAWQAGGVSLVHWTVAQYQETTPVSAANARPGDLVFYASNMSDYRTIYHVGLYLGGGQMIEAPHTGDVVKIINVYTNDLWGYGRP